MGLALIQTGSLWLVCGSAYYADPKIFSRLTKQHKHIVMVNVHLEKDPLLKMEYDRQGRKELGHPVHTIDVLQLQWLLADMLSLVGIRLAWVCGLAQQFPSFMSWQSSRGGGRGGRASGGPVHAGARLPFVQVKQHARALASYSHGPLPNQPQPGNGPWPGGWGPLA